MTFIKTYRFYLIVVLYVLTLALPFANSADLQSYGATVTATGFNFVSGHLVGFGLLLILLAIYTLLKQHHRAGTLLVLVAVGLLWLYLYASPFLVFHLGQMTYTEYLTSLLTHGLRYGYYISALVAAVFYACLLKTR